MPHSELDTDSPDRPSEELTPVDENDSPALEDRHPSQRNEFTSWREEPLSTRAISMIEHRRIIKSDRVHQSNPVKITHEVSLEPEPEPESESLEITPLIEDDNIVGLRMTCGCGATHEVRFTYGEE